MTTGIAGRLERAAFAVLGLIFLALFSFLTVARNPEFRSNQRLWEATLARDPRNGRAWYHLAAVHHRAGRPEEAEKAYLEALTADPSFPDIYGRYSDLLLGLDRPRDALRYALRGVEILGENIGRSHMNVARAHLLLDSPEEALEWLERIGRVYGRSLAFLETRGRAREALGEREGAIEDYRRIHHLTRDSDIPRQLSLLLLAEGRAREAEEVLRQLLLGVEDADAYNLLGVALGLQGGHREAAKAFRRASELDPASTIYRENLEKAMRNAAAGERNR